MQRSSRLPLKNQTLMGGTTVLLYAVLANLAANVVFSFVLAAVSLATGQKDLIEKTSVQLLGMMTIQAFYFAVPFVYFGLIKKVRPVLGISYKQKVSVFGVLIAALLGMVSMMCFYLPANWFNELLIFIGYNGSAGLKLETVPQIVWGMLVIVVLAPVLEEWIFRGFVLSGLRKGFKQVPAVLLSGLAFSLMHMSPEQTVYQFFLGCVCGYAAVKSSSVWLPAVIHAVSNLLALLFDLTALGDWFIALIRFLTPNVGVSVLSTLLLMAIGVAAVFFLGKLLRRVSPAPRVSQTEEVSADDTTNVQTSATKKIAMMLFVAALVLCFVMWIFSFVQAMKG